MQYSRENLYHDVKFWRVGRTVVRQPAVKRCEIDVHSAHHDARLRFKVAIGNFFLHNFCISVPSVILIVILILGKGCTAHNLHPQLWSHPAQKKNVKSLGLCLLYFSSFICILVKSQLLIVILGRQVAALVSGFTGQTCSEATLQRDKRDKETRRQEGLDCGDQQKHPPHLLTETNPGRPG